MKGCRSLTDQEIINVFDTLKTLRDKTLFLLGCRSGLRISEILSLVIKDVLEHDQVSNQVTVAKKNTKGKQESKTLPLTNSVKEVLKEYIDSLPNKGPNQPLFKSTRGSKAISRIQAHKILKEAFNELKLTGKVATHSMRKTYANKVHKALGSDILKTQVAMCHKSLSSTASYLQVDREEVERAILEQG